MEGIIIFGIMGALPLNLRPAYEMDLSIIISWISDANECKTWAGPAVTFPLSKESLKTQITYAAENTFCFEHNNELVAFGQLIQKSKHHLHFARIIVDPSKRGNGYGQTLCRGLIEQAVGRHCQRITLNVYKDNKAAYNLYKRLGFEESKPCSEDKLPVDICFMELMLKA